MAMCAASAAALRGILPEARMRDANSATSGVMSSSGKSWTHLQPLACDDGVSCVCLVNDELRDVNVESVPSLFPPFPCDLLVARNYQIPARPRRQAARNRCLQNTGGTSFLDLNQAESRLVVLRFFTEIHLAVLSATSTSGALDSR
jgi:hypothetical protein